MKLTLTVDSMGTIRWWVDSSHGTHMDCKGHTGMMMTLGKGATMSSSRGQKVNTGSSTETELVGVDEMLRKILWGKYFIEAQGYTVEHNILLLDNKSTMLLAKNGAFSQGKKLNISRPNSSLSRIKSIKGISRQLSTVQRTR